jgi:hypothetical protein
MMGEKLAVDSGGETGDRQKYFCDYPLHGPEFDVGRVDPAREIVVEDYQLGQQVVGGTLIVRSDERSPCRAGPKRA